MSIRDRRKREIRFSKPRQVSQKSAFDGGLSLEYDEITCKRDNSQVLDPASHDRSRHNWGLVGQTLYGYPEPSLNGENRYHVSMPYEGNMRVAMNRRVISRSSRWPWVVIFILVAVILSIGGYAYYSIETGRLRQEKYSDLRAIAKLKVGQIHQWRKGRLADVTRFTKDPFFRSAVFEWLQEPNKADLRKQLTESLNIVRNEYGYAAAFLIDPQSHILLSTIPEPPLVEPVDPLSVRKALTEGVPRLCDLHKGPGGNIYLDALGPIVGTDNKPVAVLVLRSEAKSLLYPLIESWPTPSSTAETLVVRREGNELLFLNDLRHRPDSALSFREPVTLSDLPAVQAVKGKRGRFEGRDYRRIEVLADLRQIPDSPWFMVAKMDASEILEEVQYRGGVIIAFSILFVLLAAMVTAYGYRHRQAGLYKDLYRWEREQRKIQEESRTILYSIGDAVIVTDTDSRLKQMNPVAEQLTGWTEAEAKGIPLAEIFRIVNEESRSIVEDPVRRVLRERTVIGLANHTLLIARDGTEHPIADSGAPVLDEEGNVLGVVLVFRDQTEERKAKRALEQSEERWRLAQDAAAAGTWEWDLRTNENYWSDELWELYGLEPHSCDPSYEAWVRTVHPEDREAAEKAVQDAAARGTELNAEWRVSDRKGSERWLMSRGRLVRDYRGQMVRYIGIVLDITDRKRVEAALRESEKKFRLMYEEAPIAYQSLDNRGHLLDVNKTWLELMGYTREEVIGRGFPDFMTPRSQKRFKETFADFWRDGEIYGVEHEMVRKDKSVIQVSIDGRISGGDNGDFRQTHCVFQDITQRKTAEEALRASEQRYRATFDNAAVGIYLVETQGRFLEVNETLARFLGNSEKELLGLTVFDVSHPEDVEETRKRFSAIADGEYRGYRVEKRYVRKDGTTIWGDTSVSAIGGANEQNRMIVGVIADISPRKKSEEALLRLATAVEQAAEAIEITDSKANIVYVNPAFERTTGYTRDEIIGKNPRILKSGHHDDQFYADMWNTISSGKTWFGHFINKKKNGTLFEEDVSISPVRDTSGDIVNYVAVKRDVTKEVSLQRQLLQAQKMEAIGTLAGGIAHDFNNLLQVTMGYSELLLSEKSEQDDEYGDLQKIFHAARSGADLVRSLLAFSRKVEPHPVPMNLNNQVKHVEKLLRRTIPRMIEIRLELAEDLDRISADPAQVEQVIMNLAVNGRDAMGEEGTLTIRTENVTLDEEYCRHHVEVQPGDYVQLSISDTGEGMDKETLLHIFEPFYTTKGIGRGTGLGLAMVYGTVKQHGGHVSCYSEPGLGTTFTVYLPTLGGELHERDRPVEDLPPLGTETVLLVDDEDSVRQLGKRILERAGYTVLTACNGREAIDIYSDNREKIRVIILDLIMPIMGGKDCLKELLDLDPSAKIIIASGYGADASARDCADFGARAFVAKPFRFKEILKQVRRILDEDQA